MLRRHRRVMPAADRNRQPTVLRVSDMSGIVTAVTHMLGFHPSESLVAVALRGPRERLHFTLRVDLPGPAGRYAVVEEVARRMETAGADGVLLFVFTAELPSGGELPHELLVADVMAELTIPVRDATLVSSGRLWSYVCCDPRCCPPEGRALESDSPGALAVTAAHALEGRSVLPDREAAVAAVQPLGGIAATSMRQALRRAGDALFELGVDGFSARVCTEIDELTVRFEDPRAVLTDDEAARVTLALHDVSLRDRMLVLLADDEGPLRRLLDAVARRAQPPDDAPVCTCVGWAAYVDGNGLLAAAALERALRSDPDYAMARMTYQLLHAQVAPEEIRRCAREITPQVDRGGATRRRPTGRGSGRRQRR